MTELLKGVCILVLVVCVGLMIYSIVRAIQTSKRNKATDEATRKIFLAKLQKEQDSMQNNEAAMQKAATLLKQPLTTIEPVKPKALNYDEFEEEESVMAETNGKTLKDFFSSN